MSADQDILDDIASDKALEEGMDSASGWGHWLLCLSVGGVVLSVVMLVFDYEAWGLVICLSMFTGLMAMGCLAFGSKRG